MVTKKLVEKYKIKSDNILEILYFGKNTDEILTQINDYENDNQHELRKKLAISNEYILEELLRPVESIWEAKGGSIYYGVDDSRLDGFKSHLKNIRNGMNVRKFMQEIWFEGFVTDPTGIVFLEIQDGNPILTYKKSSTIKAYQNSGTKIEWILFNSHRKTTTDKPVYWFVDKNIFQEVIETKEGYEILTEIENPFGFVPGIINSTIFSIETGNFVSPLKKQIGLLKSFLIKNSIKEIYQFLHLYPVFWQIETLCPACNGKRVDNNGDVCNVCGGTGFTGHKDVSDVLVIKKPDDENQAIIPPAGYVQPDLATMQEQRTELEWVFEQMFKSHWGTTIEKKANETATGRFIDVQPVNNKLNWYASIAENIEGKIIDLFGKFYFPLTYKQSIVTYGRRFMIESADSLLTRYNNAKLANAPTKLLDLLLEQFYYSEYQNDPQMVDYYIKMMQVEPYVHMSIADVMATQIPDNYKKEKAVFPEWQKTVSIPYVVVTDIEALKKSLTEFSLIT